MCTKTQIHKKSNACTQAAFKSGFPEPSVGYKGDLAAHGLELMPDETELCSIVIDKSGSEWGRPGSEWGSRLGQGKVITKAHRGECRAMCHTPASPPPGGSLLRLDMTLQLCVMIYMSV